ncbi:MAG: DUF5916 domain-containing protein [Gemmatimonadales bacterium]
MLQALVTAIVARALAVSPGAPSSVTAVRIDRPPTLMARAMDPSWAAVPAESSFWEWSPREAAQPAFRTEFRVAYDTKNLYVLVRAFDPHPDSIVRTVTRRDGTSASDEIGIYLAADGDRRNGYEFYVNAAGVQRDVAISADVQEDPSWDAVWDAAAQVDSAGWTASFRIPFAELRFPSDASRFGLLVNRVVARRAEQMSWPLYRPSRTGIVSQFGELDGLRDIGGSRSLAVSPFIKSQTRGSAGVTAGADLRVGLASNVTLNAAVLPDFGQVEADPSVVNLSTVETFFPEQRPFFLEGAGTYAVSFNCNAVNCANEGLFYSRRIGRDPQLAGLYGVQSDATAVPILAAAKLTGRSESGSAFGALVAETERASSSDGKTAEPATTYAVVRGQRSFRDDQSGASVVTTIVDRANDQWTAPYLPQTAIVSGGTFRHRFLDNQFEVWGDATMSRLAGTAAAITAIQENSVHLAQRPGSAHRVDSARTTLVGDQEELAVGNYGGRFQFETSFERQSPEYDSNDLGYLQRADQQTVSAWGAYVDRTPRALWNSIRWNVNQWDTWNASGTRLEDAANSNVHIVLRNNWGVNGGATLSQIGATECDHCARGGPAIRVEPQVLPWLTIQGDARAPIVPGLSANWTFGDGGRSRISTINPTVDLRVTSRLQATLGLLFGATDDDSQWLGNFTDGATTHYVFAHLVQHTRALTFRASFAATPKLSIESYAEPFASDGTYSAVRELSASPLARAYEDRFQPYAPPAGTPLAFGLRQLRATTVLRWEYEPGAALFLVWSHERDGQGLTGDGSWVRDARQLFALPPVNTIAVKVSLRVAR